VPIITNKDGVIADGEHRWRAAQELGMTTVPIIRLQLKEVERKIIRQVMNKLRGMHEYDLDAAEIQLINDGDGKDVLLSLTAMSENEYFSFLDEKKQLDALQNSYDENKIPVFREELFFTFSELQVFEKYLNLKRASRYEEILNKIPSDHNAEFEARLQEFSNVNVKSGRIERKIIDLMRRELGEF
jgi:hypothetical protein